MTQDICPKCKLTIGPYEKLKSSERGNSKMRYLHCKYCEIVVMKTSFAKEEQEEESEDDGIKISGFGRDL